MKIIRRPEGYLLIDDKNRTIRPGDRIRIGSTLLVFNDVFDLPRSLEVEARIYRSPAPVDRFTARPDEPLAMDATVAPGDRLSLEVEGNEPMYVYVLTHDEAGEARVNFPLPALDLQNPLPAGTSHRLPGTRNGEEVFWIVSSAGGEEEFLVIASREPLRYLESRIADVPDGIRNLAAGESGIWTRTIRLRKMDPGTW